MERNLAKFRKMRWIKSMSISPPPALLWERYNMPVVADLVEREQPAHLRDWFRERLIAHRLASVSLSRLPWEPKQK